jgi:4-carboxymuconolactone decarboxylase
VGDFLLSVDLVLLSALVALGKCDEFRMRAALSEGGFTADDVNEIIVTQTAYCGAPAGNHAFKEAGEIVKELGKTE